MLTNLEQAKRLKKIGYDGDCDSHFDFNESQRDSFYSKPRNHNIYERKVSRPSVSKSLQWIRENKGVECAVMLGYETNLKEAFYYGEYITKKTDKGALVENTDTFDTFPLAESALLDSVLGYLDGEC